MILYFSGTGNSAYVANKIGKAIEDESYNLLEKLQHNDHSPLHSEKPWVIVAPTYAWRIPRILHDWLLQTPLRGNKSIYFVMTCGGNIGNASAYVEKLCISKELIFKGCFPIVMPENYIALFNTPTREEALNTIQLADTSIDYIMQVIKQKESYHSTPIQAKDKINSGLVNHLFYPLFVHAKKFTVSDQCVSCGHCVNVCPLQNIQLKKGIPTWGTSCTHCMACICQCPKEAIEYGKHSQGLPRYTCPKNI